MKIETITHETDSRVPTGWEVRISYDAYPANPREWDSSPWLLLTRHRDIIGIDGEYAPWEVPDACKLAVPIYYDPGPSGQGIYRADHTPERIPPDDPELWPSGMIGFAFLVADLEAEGWTEQNARNCLDGELSDYTQWANGEVYCWDVYYRGHHKESVGGFYDLDDCRHEAIQTAIYYAQRQSEAAADLQKTAILAGLGHN